MSGAIFLGIFALISVIIAALLIRWAWKDKSESPVLRIFAYTGAGCLLVMLVGCPAILFPVFMQAREAAKRTSCLTNLQQVGKGLQMYLAEHDDRFPSGRWCDAMSEYVDRAHFACPALEGAYGYSLNQATDGGLIADMVEDPKAFVVGFDGGGAANTLAGQSGVDWDRHLSKASLLFLDAAVQVMPPESAGDLQWSVER